MLSSRKRPSQQNSLPLAASPASLFPNSMGENGDLQDQIDRNDDLVAKSCGDTPVPSAASLPASTHLLPNVSRTVRPSLTRGRPIARAADSSLKATDRRHSAVRVAVALTLPRGQSVFAELAESRACVRRGGPSR